MNVKKDANGRRSVETEFDVVGTPEQVWQAIATGPGISAWFVPAEIEEKDGKPAAMKLQFAPGIEIGAAITAWDPPRMFTTRGDVPGAPPFATEWTVEARAGGVCRVRIVQSLFASTDEWDNQLESAMSNWVSFFGILRLYLKHFPGQRSAIMQVTAPVATSEAETWATLTQALGVKGVKVGQRCTATADAPALSGVLEYLTENPYDALLRLDKPGPGVAALGATTYPGGQGMVGMYTYIYGDQAEKNLARVKPLWEAWFQKRFPTPVET
jgi:uncharacterized protein YndB with AHSA1/START domain